MGKYIPRDTLHRSIHASVIDVPVPDGRYCRRAFEELTRLEAEGLIDIEADTCEARLDFLINLWKNSCPETVSALKKERAIIHGFYERSDP